ncbi:MAG: hypothetical protein KDH92_04485 [Chloroflexi bacterium]|nr:hypothetical protein [Chloroflexota bacterium]
MSRRKARVPAELLEELIALGLDEFSDEDAFDLADGDPGAMFDLIDEGLEALRVADLRQIARQQGWRLSGTRRDDIVDQIRARYEDPASIAGMIESLDPRLRRGLDLVAWAASQSRADLVKRVTAMAALAGEDYADLDHGVGAMMDALSARGLLLRDGFGALFVPPPIGIAVLPVEALFPALDVSTLQVDDAPDPYGQLLRLAAAIQKGGGVTRASPWSAEVAVPRHQQVPEWNWPSSRAQLPGRLQLVPAAGSWLAAGDRKRLAKTLGERDPLAVDFLFILLLGLNGFADLPEARHRLQIADGWIEELCQQGAEILVAALLEAWIGVPYGGWDPYSAVALAGGPRLLRHPYRVCSPNQYSEFLARLRRGCIRLIRRLPTERWVDLDRFVALVGASQPELIDPSSNGSGLGLAPPDGHAIQALDTAQAWSDLGEPVLRFVLEGPMRWLGLIELARDRQGRARALRRGPLARPVLGLGPSEQVPADAPTWSNRGDVGHLRLGLGNADQVRMLSEWCRIDLEADGRLRVEPDRDRLLASLEAGANPIASLTQLRDAGAIPKPLAGRLERWCDTWGRANVYPGLSLIEFAEASLSHELLARANLAEHILYRVGETRWLVEDAVVPSVLAALERAGQHPRIVDRRGGHA